MLQRRMRGVCVASIDFDNHAMHVAFVTDLETVQIVEWIAQITHARIHAIYSISICFLIYIYGDDDDDDQISRCANTHCCRANQ